jgi:hypothetical protein
MVIAQLPSSLLSPVYYTLGLSLTHALGRGGAFGLVVSLDVGVSLSITGPAETVPVQKNINGMHMEFRWGADRSASCRGPRNQGKKTFTDECAVMLDGLNPIDVLPAGESVEWKVYWASWVEK